MAGRPMTYHGLLEEDLVERVAIGRELLLKSDPAERVVLRLLREHAIATNDPEELRLAERLIAINDAEDPQHAILAAPFAKAVPA